VLSLCVSKTKANTIGESPYFGMLGMLGNAMRRLSSGGRTLKLESEEQRNSNGGGRETTIIFCNGDSVTFLLVA
jgi:hypothetical protein